MFKQASVLLVGLALLAGCGNVNLQQILGGSASAEPVRTSSAAYPQVVRFSGSQSSQGGLVYEILPGPAAMNPAMSPTPFSDDTQQTTGSYRYRVQDSTPDDAVDSQDAVVDIDLSFVGNDGTTYRIDQIDVIHKAAGTGDHTFFGGVGLNKMMHGDTGIGTGLMPKMLSYITLWGVTDLKDVEGNVVAPGRLVHLMTGTRVRDDNLRLIASGDVDRSDHNLWRAETHVILPPLNLQGEMAPVPGTDHGFLHMMWEEAELSEPDRDPTLVYEVLPGPAAMNPAMDPTPFSNRVAVAGGSYTLTAFDGTPDDSESSQDAIQDFNLRFTRADGTTLRIDRIDVIHKAAGMGDHTFFGGVGFDKEMHGDTGIGVPMMPKMLSYITLWGLVDLKDGDGNVLASNRLVHIMVASRARTADLKLLTSMSADQTDHDPSMAETHIILPPQDMAGNMSPVPGTGHGFLHLMFEQVAWQ